MKLSNLIDIRNVLLAHINDKLYANVAYKLMKFIKASEDENTFYNTKLKELIDIYGEKNVAGTFMKDEAGNVKIKHERVTECLEAINVLKGADVECPRIRFSIGELSELKLTVSEVYALDEIIEEG